MEKTAEEIESLSKNQARSFTELPPGMRIVGCKLIFKTKHDIERKIQKSKAWLVAKEYFQKYGGNYDEIF